jgi:hypothetical protein
MSSLAEKLRAAVGAETPAESYAALVRTFKVAALACDAHNALLDAETPGAQSDFSVQRAADDASSEMCAGIEIPTFSTEIHGANAAFLSRSALCQLKNRHDITLFTPAEK